MCIILMLRGTLEYRCYYYPRVIAKETKAQRGSGSCLTPHSYEVNGRASPCTPTGSALPPGRETHGGQL